MGGQDFEDRGLGGLGEVALDASGRRQVDARGNLVHKKQTNADGVSTAVPLYKRRPRSSVRTAIMDTGIRAIDPQSPTRDWQQRRRPKSLAQQLLAPRPDPPPQRKRSPKRQQVSSVRSDVLCAPVCDRHESPSGRPRRASDLNPDLLYDGLSTAVTRPRLSVREVAFRTGLRSTEARDPRSLAAKLLSARDRTPLAPGLKSPLAVPPEPMTPVPRIVTGLVGGPLGGTPSKSSAGTPSKASGTPQGTPRTPRTPRGPTLAEREECHELWLVPKLDLLPLGEDQLWLRVQEAVCRACRCDRALVRRVDVVNEPQKAIVRFATRCDFAVNRVAQALQKWSHDLLDLVPFMIGAQPTRPRETKAKTVWHTRDADLLNPHRSERKGALQSGLAAFTPPPRAGLVSADDTHEAQQRDYACKLEQLQRLHQRRAPRLRQLFLKLAGFSYWERVRAQTEDGAGRAFHAWTLACRRSRHAYARVRGARRVLFASWTWWRQAMPIGQRQRQAAGLVPRQAVGRDKQGAYRLVFDACDGLDLPTSGREFARWGKAEQQEFAGQVQRAAALAAGVPVEQVQVLDLARGSVQVVLRLRGRPGHAAPPLKEAQVRDALPQCGLPAWALRRLEPFDQRAASERQEQLLEHLLAKARLFLRTSSSSRRLLREGFDRWLVSSDRLEWLGLCALDAHALQQEEVLLDRDPARLAVPALAEALAKCVRKHALRPWRTEVAERRKEAQQRLVAGRRCFVAWHTHLARKVGTLRRASRFAEELRAVKSAQRGHLALRGWRLVVVQRQVEAWRREEQYRLEQQQHDTAIVDRRRARAGRQFVLAGRWAGALLEREQARVDLHRAFRHWWVAVTLGIQEREVHSSKQQKADMEEFAAQTAASAQAKMHGRGRSAYRVKPEDALRRSRGLVEWRCRERDLNLLRASLRLWRLEVRRANQDTMRTADALLHKQLDESTEALVVEALNGIARRCDASWADAEYWEGKALQVETFLAWSMAVPKHNPRKPEWRRPSK